MTYQQLHEQSTQTNHGKNLFASVFFCILKDQSMSYLSQYYDNGLSGSTNIGLLAWYDATDRCIKRIFSRTLLSN